MKPTVTLWLVWLLLGACAHVEAPPGGPDDKVAPRVLVTRPESLAVVPGWDSPVVLAFDERISERGVEEAVTVSPRTSAVRIDRGRDEIRVSLRGGWQPGTIYHVTVKPAIQDLFNNPLAGPVTVVFSTGPEIPETGVAGRVVDRITGKGEPDLRVEAIRSPDSLVYSVSTDSAGGFAIPHMPGGSYSVRAFRDMNRSRALDPYEPRDSAQAEITAAASAEVSLSIVAPDSTAPRLASATAETANRVELRFDDYLDPVQSLAPAAVQITDSAGVFVPVATVSLEREGASARAPDTARTAGADTSRAPSPAAPPPLPSQTLVVQLAEGAELAPGKAYRATVRAVRNVVGLEGGGEADFRGPPAPAEPAAATPAAAPAVDAPAPGTPPPAAPGPGTPPPAAPPTGPPAPTDRPPRPQ